MRRHGQRGREPRPGRKWYADSRSGLQGLSGTETKKRNRFSRMTRAARGGVIFSLTTSTFWSRGLKSPAVFFCENVLLRLYTFCLVR